MTAPRVVNCPTCGTQLEWISANRYRPFCSERCKLIDLGAWATETYRVPVEDQDNDSDTSPGGERQGAGTRIQD